VAVCVSAALSGCGRKTEPPPAPPPTPALQATGQADANPAPAEPDLNQLSREVRKWIVRNQRPPNSFEEFAASGQAQIPPPPVGKKYALDRQMRVILVNR
jgi:hypothetical protein